MRYFYKELPEQVYAPNGRPINVDFVDPDGYGWLATDNGYIVNQIELATRSRVGGWVQSDKEAYDLALKKKETAPAQSNRNQHSFQPFHLARAGAAGFVEAGNTSPGLPGAAPKPDPIAVPSPSAMVPRIGRVSVRPPPTQKG